jgi:hypothetical protein
MVFAILTDKTKMKLFILIGILASVSWGFSAENGERTLSDAVKDYSTLQAQIDQLLKLKIPGCTSEMGNEKNPLCSVKNICERPEIIKDGPVLYKNAAGESIFAENYYSTRNDLNTCLKDKFSDEISSNKDELLQKLGASHLKKILAANRKLSDLVQKYNQGSALSKISAEILNMSIEAGLDNSDLGWDKEGTERDDLMKLIGQAEKKTKLKLNSEIKKTLVEIQYLKNNPDYKKEAEKLNAQIIGNIVPEDPFYDWSKLSDQKNINLLTKKSQEAYELFKSTSNEMVLYLKSKRTKDNALMIDRMVEKVKTMRFEPPRLTETLTKHCSYPNAFYSPKTHALTICPQMLNYPKAALMETLAHEMAHSFDSCNFSAKFYKARGPGVAEEAPFEIDLKMDASAGNFKTTYDEDVRGEKVQDKIRMSEHPFAKTMSCLQEENSVGAVVIDQKNLMKKVDASLDDLKKSGQDVPDNSVASYLHHLKEKGKDYFDYFGGCDLSNNGGDGLLRNQMQEAFADKMASEIVAKKIATLSKSDAEKAVLEISVSYENLCFKEGRTDKMLRDFAVKEGCQQFYENKTEEEKILKAVDMASPGFDPHPKDKVRIEKNLLAHPLIRKALNCAADKGVKYCE